MGRSVAEKSEIIVLNAARVNLRDGQVVGPRGVATLATKEAAMLAYLVARPGVAISEDELLREVWGYRAPVVTRAVGNVLLKLRQKLERDPGRPEHLITEHGVGIRFEPRIEAEVEQTVPEADNAPPASERPLTNLIRRRDRMFGREREIDALGQRLVAGERLLTLWGPGGIGKTRLASELALRELETGLWPGGVWFCALQEAVSPEDVLSVIARVLDVPLSAATEAAAAQLVRALRTRGKMLLVLDNLEQVVAQVGDLLRTWLDGAPALVLMVTSRETVRLIGESVLEVGPLSTSPSRDGKSPTRPIRRGGCPVRGRFCRRIGLPNRFG